MMEDLTNVNLDDLIYDLHSLGITVPEKKGKFDYLNVASIHPADKDVKRADMLGVKPGGIRADGPLQGKANSQAKAIQDFVKMVRRSKAVVSRWGIGDHETENGIVNPWKPFRDKMIDTGFSAGQIQLIEEYDGSKDGWGHETPKESTRRPSRRRGPGRRRFR